MADSRLRTQIKTNWKRKTYWWWAQPPDPNKRCLWFRVRVGVQRPLIKKRFTCYQAPQGSSFILHHHLRTKWMWRQWGANTAWLSQLRNANRVSCGSRGPDQGVQKKKTPPRLMLDVALSAGALLENCCEIKRNGKKMMMFLAGTFSVKIYSRVHDVNKRKERTIH